MYLLYILLYIQILCFLKRYALLYDIDDILASGFRWTKIQGEAVGKDIQCGFLQEEQRNEMDLRLDHTMKWYTYAMDQKITLLFLLYLFLRGGFATVSKIP